MADATVLLLDDKVCNRLISGRSGPPWRQMLLIIGTHRGTAILRVCRPFTQVDCSAKSNFRVADKSSPIQDNTFLMTCSRGSPTVKGV
jgi:hypothetical protein